MKISKLALEAILGTSLEKMKSRRTGKTTGVALTIIGMAMTKPDVPVKVTESNNNLQQDYHLRNVVEEIIRKLELNHFHLNKAQNMIVYKPFVTVIEE